MPDREWPSREDWAADAARHVRQACYDRQRVSDDISTWATPEEQAQLAHIARNARLAASRAVRVLERDGRASTSEIDLYDLHRLIRAWDEIQQRQTDAGKAATEEAVTAEIARRRTDEAWARELERRKQIDGDWINVFRPNDNDADPSRRTA